MARVRTDNIRRNINKIIDNSEFRPWTAGSEAQTRFGAILDKSGRLLTLKQANAKAVAAGRPKFTAGEFGQLAQELQGFNDRVTLTGEKAYQQGIYDMHVADLEARGVNLDGLSQQQIKDLFREVDAERRSKNAPSEQFYVIFNEKAAEARRRLGLSDEDITTIS